MKDWEPIDHKRGSEAGMKVEAAILALGSLVVIAQMLAAFIR